LERDYGAGLANTDESLSTTLESIRTIVNAFNKALVTGGAGFIGSNLTDTLLAMGKEVVVIDNLSTGQSRFLESAKGNPNFQFVEGDLRSVDDIESAMQGCDFVFHLAANADIRFGFRQPRADLENNTIATFNVLESMRKLSVSKIVFASSSAALGEPTVFPTPEDCAAPIQTSLYGASKMAGEGMISAYCEGAGFEGYVFRFVSLLGKRYPHGHVFDFCRSLFSDPSRLKVLGDGKQRKSFLNVQDCIAAILHVVSASTAANAKHRFQVYNLGSPDYIEVNQSVQWICERLKIRPQLEFAGGERGWVGDSPFVFLDTAKIVATGWHRKYTIRQSIEETVDWLQQNQWIFGSR
jgi:UDP-glucose 4-epimerase